MVEKQPTIASEIKRYLRTGQTDPHHAAWPGGFMERAIKAHADLRDALVRKVTRLAAGRQTHRPLIDADVAALTRRKIEPMVRGLFPRVEQDPVLATLERSVIFLTSTTIEPLLRDHGFHSSAWDLANLYLASVGAELLADDAPSIVGLSEGTTCYLSQDYFADKDPFADFIIHETAHIFHNCKRREVGLRATRTKEWLLDIEYRKRETFAYSCEAFGCLARRAMNLAQRRQLADEYGRAARISDERVDHAEVADIVREAAAARNGWKLILRRCRPTN